MTPDPVREALARKLLAMPDDPAADLPIGALRDEHREAVRVLEQHVRALDSMSRPLGQAVTQYTADENKAKAIAIRKSIDCLRASHPPAAAEPAVPADLRRSLWNAAVEACALVVQPIPHVEEERTCGEVAAAIRELLLVAPPLQPTQQATGFPYKATLLFDGETRVVTGWCNPDPAEQAAPAVQALPPIVKVLAEWEDANGSLSGILDSEWFDLMEYVTEAAIEQSPRQLRAALADALISKALGKGKP